jgi:hypothetical protein
MPPVPANYIAVWSEEFVDWDIVLAPEATI